MSDSLGMLLVILVPAVFSGLVVFVGWFLVLKMVRTLGRAWRGEDVNRP